jgi:hypothetical protein
MKSICFVGLLLVLCLGSNQAFGDPSTIDKELMDFAEKLATVVKDHGG